MHQQLNIPLTQQTTRRSPWRVVWIAMLLISITVGIWTSLRLVQNIDKTTTFRPNETVQTLHVVKTAKNTRILEENIGNEPIFINHPWTYSHLLEWSHNEYSLHYNQQQQLIGISIDDELKSSAKASLEMRGFSVFTINKLTLITTSDGASHPKKRFSLQAIHPNYQGSYITYLSEIKTMAPIRVHEHGITILAKNSQLSTSDAEFMPEGTIIGNISLTSASFLLPSLLESALGTATVIELHNLANQTHIQSTFIKDESGLGISLYIRQPNIDTESLARISEEIIRRTSLTTAPLTLEDGSVINEIIPASKSISSEITTTDSSTVIIASNENGDEIHTHVRDEGYYLSNRPLIEISETTYKNTCLHNSKNYLKLSELEGLLIEHSFATNIHTTTLFSPFSELAFTKKRLRMCW